MRRGKSNIEYLFKVRLKHRRSLWRSVALRGDQNLEDLHEIIFTAFDRYDIHLNSFYFPNASAGQSQSRGWFRQFTPPQWFEADFPLEIDHRYNAADTRLDELNLTTGQTFEYLFDFGDEWWHEIKLEAIVPSESGEKYPHIVEKKGPSPLQYPESED